MTSVTDLKKAYNIDTKSGNVKLENQELQIALLEAILVELRK